MVVDDVPAWSPRLRSRTRLRVAPTRHFADPSLAVAALRATPARLLSDIEWLGFLFESLVVRDLRAYAGHLGGSVYHYRDETGLEVDAIVELPDGRWAGFEVKLGAGRVEEGAASLRKLAARVDPKAAGQPLALGVITATGYGYTRDDGVAVIPIGTLGP
jgi:predicted AAA+ superfamily ATPase